MIIERIQQVAPPGTVIPKPRAKGDFIVKGVGIRRGERAIIYTIPNHREPNNRYEKGINASELERAFQELIRTGEFTRQWMKEHLSTRLKDGGRNFTSIGGLFVLQGEARYTGPGMYRKR
jgi:hypothetical protein